ncbi:MAG: diphthine--ammonia ligase [Crenarchaeota archaeon]|nr:diphthine--ammonia ligase [Thermoproteota archaeon]
MCLDVAVLFTGGKDSSFALYWMMIQGFRVRCLVSIIPDYEDSMLYHRPMEDILRLQAESIGLPLVTIRVSRPEEELEALRKALVVARDDYGIEGVASGALLSDYQRMRYSMIAEELGLKSYTPLWRIDQKKYMYELIDAGIKFMIISISSYGLPHSLLGKVIDDHETISLIIKLAERYGFNPAFEGGEAETLVIDAPFFSKKICINGIREIKGPYNSVYRITDYGYC